LAFKVCKGFSKKIQKPFFDPWWVAWKAEPEPFHMHVL